MVPLILGNPYLGEKSSACPVLWQVVGGLEAGIGTEQLLTDSYRKHSI